MDFEKTSHLYKVLIVGDFAVGKTSLIRRYCLGEFTQNYKLTIGVDFSTKSVNYNDSTNVTLQLWDIAGHERFGGLTRVYYKFAIATVIVFDVTRPSTLESVKKWREDINDKVVLPNGDPIPMVLLANKADMPGIDISTFNLDEFCREYGFFAWFPTSAKNNINVDDAFGAVLNKVMELNEIMNLPSPNKKEGEGQDSVNIAVPGRKTGGEQAPVQPQQKGGCC